MEDLVLPDGLRYLLKKPFGEVLEGAGRETALKAKKLVGKSRIVIVGDVTLRNMLEVGVVPDLAVVDLKTKRTEEMKDLAGDVIEVKNPPGMITSELWEKVSENIDKGVTLLVEGEEDLAVIPCVLEADWNSFVLYGQPDVGIVAVEVTEEVKERAGMIVRLMQEGMMVKTKKGDICGDKGNQ